MKVKNFLTGKDIEFNNVCSITDDGKHLDKITFDLACSYFRIGHMNSDKVLEYLNKCKECEDLIFTILNKCARYAMDKGVYVSKIVNKVKEAENLISINKYKKLREFLELDEYKQVIAELDNHLPWITGVGTSMSVEERKSFSGTHRNVVKGYIEDTWLAMLMPNHTLIKQY